jgi:hypothetical protein
MRVVFYCETDAPSGGRNMYKKENVFECSVEKRFLDNTNQYEIVNIKTALHEVLITMHYPIANIQPEMVRGFVYLNGKEFIVKQYATFRSLQIETSCYDNIIVIWTNHPMG